MSKLRKVVKRLFRLYDIEDLVIGGHCGGCGQWIPGTIFSKDSPWGICDDCVRGARALRKKRGFPKPRPPEVPDVPIPPPPAGKFKTPSDELRDIAKEVVRSQAGGLRKSQYWGFRLQLIAERVKEVK